LRDALGTRHDVGPWSGNREHLHRDPARIHVRQSCVTEMSQRAPLDDLSPDDIGPREATTAPGIVVAVLWQYCRSVLRDTWEVKV
jgi:hypothetical protein